MKCDVFLFLHQNTTFIVVVIGPKRPGKHLKAGHHRPTSETPLEWRFAGGLMVARHRILAGLSH